MTSSLVILVFILSPRVNLFSEAAGVWQAFPFMLLSQNVLQRLNTNVDDEKELDEKGF